MEPDICPPYWPLLIWILLHSPHGPHPTGDVKETVRVYDELFRNIAIGQMSRGLIDRDASKVAGQAAHQGAVGALERLSSM